MFSPFHVTRFLSLAWVFVTVLGSPITPHTNIGTFVNLRVEGLETTIFEGPVFTRGHNVTTVSAGTLHCDGTNNGENPSPGPTCTSALDDAARRHGFTFDGTLWSEFDDIFITTIGDSAQTATQFWGILLNFEFTPVGGCQQQVKLGDDVLFAFDAFSKNHFLKLAGPVSVHAGQPAQFTVTDGMTQAGIEGATVVASASGVGSQESDADGNVSFTFNTRGIYSLKANKDDSIRSNGIIILVI